MPIKSIDELTIDKLVHESTREHCGLVVTHDLQDLYDMMKSLNHRGREAAGIAAIGDTIDVMKWLGAVSAFDWVDISKLFDSTKSHYHTFIGHVRYATRGRKDKILQDTHPHAIGGKITDYGNHRIIRDCDAVIAHNGQISEEYLKIIDKSKLKTDCDTEALLQFFKEHGEQGILRQIPGSYTLAIASKDRKDVIVLRDSLGIKPGALGEKNGKSIVSSEDVAFKKNGGKWTSDLESGAIYYLEPEGGYRKERILKPNKIAYCMFEYKYISDLDSILDSVPVRTYRYKVGQTLAEEFHPDDIDIISCVPRCPETTAKSFAAEYEKICQKTGMYKDVFYKRNSSRSFIGSTPEERAESISNNLYMTPQIANELQGQVLCLVDDSIIRGNNILRAISLAKAQEVKKIYVVSYTPPIGIIGSDGIPRGCNLGVDMPSNDAFVIRKISEDKEVNRTYAEVGEKLGAEIYYLSVEGMFRTFENLGMPRNHLCTFCVGGKHPFD
jgi:amidophosphoribosyltransferase